MAAANIHALPVTFAAHIIAVAVSAMVIVCCVKFRGGLAWESANKSLIFNIHPVLMLFGFIIMGGEAIMIYKSVPLKKEVRKMIHLVLHAIALIIGIVGIIAAFKYHNESGIVNLYSLHSWIGILTITLYAIQWLYGFGVFFVGGTARLRAESLPWHSLVGITCFVLAVCNASVGFLEKLTFLEASGLNKYGSEAVLVNCTALFQLLRRRLITSPIPLYNPYVEENKVFNVEVKGHQEYSYLSFSHVYAFRLHAPAATPGFGGVEKFEEGEWRSLKKVNEVDLELFWSGNQREKRKGVPIFMFSCKISLYV